MSFFIFSVNVCIIQHRNRPLKSTALNAHGTDASADGLCARTHTLTKPCRAGFAVSRSELIEPGAATCGLRDIAGPCVKFQKLGTVCARHQYTITFFFLFWKKFCRARPQPTALFRGRTTVCLTDMLQVTLLLCQAHSIDGGTGRVCGRCSSCGTWYE